MNWNDLVGKTIAGVDGKCSNVIHIDFTDGTKITAEANILSSGLGIISLQKQWPEANIVKHVEVICNQRGKHVKDGTTRFEVLNEEQCGFRFIVLDHRDKKYYINERRDKGGKRISDELICFDDKMKYNKK